MLHFISIVLLLFTSCGYVSAKKKKHKHKDKEFRKIKVKKKKKDEKIDYDKDIVRSKFDKDIDQMISDTLGKNYRRANVYDLYPMEIPQLKARFMSHDDEIELMDYYDYARRDLIKISQSKLLKVVKLNFDRDADWDYATIVFDKKKDKLELVVMNFKENLYQKDFAADFIEEVNDGKFPTTLVFGKKRKSINSPAIRIVDFNDESKILYFDFQSKEWELIGLNDN